MCSQPPQNAAESRIGGRDANKIRRELETVLRRVPANGLVFTRQEVDRIAEALGGYPRLREVVDGD